MNQPFEFAQLVLAPEFLLIQRSMKTQHHDNFDHMSLRFPSWAGYPRGIQTEASEKYLILSKSLKVNAGHGSKIIQDAIFQPRIDLSHHCFKTGGSVYTLYGWPSGAAKCNVNTCRQYIEKHLAKHCRLQCQQMQTLQNILATLDDLQMALLLLFYVSGSYNKYYKRIFRSFPQWKWLKITD